MFRDNTWAQAYAVSCLISSRSVTYAQRYIQLLKSNGIRAYMHRLPSTISDAGCGHAVSVGVHDLAHAISLLKQNRADNLRVWCANQDGEYEEMLT
ncbi:MAG: DUF3343 domain-containing protein [Oscillospiraceae bacterium]|jgi:hypothetical protein|nr:DUF3343 domain-containing protein [Oscillospiraceae bacterium]